MGLDGDSSNPIVVKYRNQHYDITKFISKHPGGINTLKGLEDSDMTARFLKAPPHSDAALYLLNEYKIPNQKKDIKHRLNSSANIDVDENRNENHNIKVRLDESMEHMVDWNKAMLPQIKNITDHYDEWVHKPVDRPLRLFQAGYLEMLTKTPWWIVPSFWLPVISYALYSEAFMLHKNPLQLQLVILRFVIGVIFWSFLEYSLHRWVFHMKVDASSGTAACTFHFLLHGLHHKVPFDASRLVFPPLPAVIIATTIYYPLSHVVLYSRILLGGALFGYVCYDLMHYYLHYGNPNIWHMYQMKRYHYQHHFSHQDMGFGISSPLWDLVFGTTIHLRTLKIKLKWK